MILPQPKTNKKTQNVNLVEKTNLAPLTKHSKLTKDQQTTHKKLQ